VIKFIQLEVQKIASIKIMHLAITICNIFGKYAREKQSLTGKLIDQKSNQAIACIQSLANIKKRSLLYK
jgi:hypothetical protein